MTPTFSHLLDYLYGFLSPNRQEKIKKNLINRTRYVTVILEDMHQSHNIAAIMRSCDALGVQDMHCIEQKNTLQIKRNISMGASKWLTVSRYNENNTKNNHIKTCIENLKKQGYRIVATSPHGIKTLNELSLDSKIALLFGTEDEGLSSDALALADELITIPMYGFVESLNVSVSVALSLYDLTNRLRSSNLPWQLLPEEKQQLELDWLRVSVNRSDIREREFYKNNPTSEKNI